MEQELSMEEELSIEEGHTITSRRREPEQEALK
jgi:hypothetical protein